MSSEGLIALAGVTTAVLAFGGLTAVAQATPADTPSNTASGANPYSPDYQHPHRHGVMPTRQQATTMRACPRRGSYSIYTKPYPS